MIMKRLKREKGVTIVTSAEALPPANCINCTVPGCEVEDTPCTLSCISMDIKARSVVSGCEMGLGGNKNDGRVN